MFVTAEAAGSRSIESIKKGPRLRHGPFLIDATGFEPATSASRIEPRILVYKELRTVRRINKPFLKKGAGSWIGKL